MTGSPVVVMMMMMMMMFVMMIVMMTMYRNCIIFSISDWKY